MLKSNFTKHILGLVLACSAHLSFGQVNNTLGLSGDSGGLSESCSTVGGCDTIGLKRVVSPWRLGGFLGPGIAYCGSWANTFPLSEARDNTMFNGISINGNFSADYYLTKNDSARFKFALGATFGFQHFFMRKGYWKFIDQALANKGLGRDDAEIHNSTSEDFYLVVGPVFSLSLGKSPKSPYLEGAIKGGIFRTTPASISVRLGEQTNFENIYLVSPNYKRYRPGGLASLGLFFPMKNRWALGVQAQGFTTKVSYDMPHANSLFRFDRAHGGFALGVAVRKGFEYDRPFKKAPSAGLSCIAPSLELVVNNESISGKFFNPQNPEKATLGPIIARWSSRTDTVSNENFTARIHHLLNGQDKVIAEVVCKPETSLEFPKEYLNQDGFPIEGQYYVTVQSLQSSACASCVSEVSASGFASKFIAPIPEPEPMCLHKVELSSVQVVSKKIKKWAKSANCADCICPTDEVVTRRTRNKIILHKEDFKNCDDFAPIESVIGKVKAPNWAKEVTINVETTKTDPKAGTITTTTKTYKAKVNNDGSLTSVGVQ